MPKPLSLKTDYYATAQLNSTSDPFGTTLIEVLPASLVTTYPSTNPTAKSKAHRESSASGFDDATAAGSRVHVEVTASDFTTLPTTAEDRGSENSITMIDIGTVIQSIVTSWAALPTVHFEKSASDWEKPTAVSSGIVHFESSANGWDNTVHQDPSIPQSTLYKPVEVSDDPWTKDVQTPPTTVPGGPQANPPQITTIPSKVITDFPTPPAITHDGITLRPIAVTRKLTVTLPGARLTTTEQVELQIVVGSSTLSIGAPLTVNNVVIGVTTDAAGSTILSAGDMTTTLPKPTAGEVRTVAADTPEQLNIVTAVISGTTKYVLAGQTLAPGQPVTVGDTPISITTSDHKTILFVGDVTTTLAAAESDIQSITDWASVSAGTQGTIANSNSASANPTSTRSGSSRSVKVDGTFAYFAVGMGLLVITA